MHLEPSHTVTLRVPIRLAEKIVEIANRDGLRFSPCLLRLLSEAVAARESQEGAP